MKKLNLRCGDASFAITRQEAMHIGVLRELWPETCEDTVVLDGLVTAEALKEIVDFARHGTPAAPARPRLATTAILDYMTRWEAEWVAKFSDTALRDILKACHALHYDAPKYVCLYHILLRRRTGQPQPASE